GVDFPIPGRHAAESGGRLGVLGPDFLNRIPDALDAGRQLLRVAMAANVHEKDLRFVEEEMIVEGRYLESLLKGRVHGRGDLVLKDDRIAHHHGAMRRRRERRPRAKPGEWLESHGVHLEWDIFPCPFDTDYTIFTFGFSTRGTGDFLRVELALVL